MYLSRSHRHLVSLVVGIPIRSILATMAVKPLAIGDDSHVWYAGSDGFNRAEVLRRVVYASHGEIRRWLFIALQV